MAVFLVDYENVNEAGGLWGVELLTPKDVLYIFYSVACPNIGRRAAEQIEKSGCEFNVVFLQGKGKNALDFLIVSQMGILAERGHKNIAIISRDQGFNAARNFIMDAKASGLKGMHVVVAESINASIRQLPNEPEIGYNRHQEAIWAATKIDLRVFHEEYLKKVQIRKDIAAAFKDTPHFPILDKISAYAIDCLSMKTGNDRYRAALKTFGGKDGLDIYQKLKPVTEGFYENAESKKTDKVPGLKEKNGDRLAELLKENLKGSPLQSSFDQIYELACKLVTIKNKQERYMLCLAVFGNITGQSVYQVLKLALAKISS